MFDLSISRLEDSVTYRAAKMDSAYWQWRFSKASLKDYVNPPTGHSLSTVHVYSFSGQKQLPEQILSMLSFFRHLGMPGKWTVVSDGELAANNWDLLKAVCPVLEKAEWRDFINAENRECVDIYSRVNPMGKKLAIVTSLPYSPTTLYMDTDVLFFQGAAQFRELLQNANSNYFVRDMDGALINPLVNSDEEKLPPLNGGVLVQAKPISWVEPLDRLKNLFRDQPDVLKNRLVAHLLEQSVLHSGYHSSGAQALDSSRYIIKVDDTYKWRDDYVGSETVLRHYVANSRLKFWRNARFYLR